MSVTKMLIHKFLNDEAVALRLASSPSTLFFVVLFFYLPIQMSYQIEAEVKMILCLTLVFWPVINLQDCLTVGGLFLVLE